MNTLTRIARHREIHDVYPRRRRLTRLALVCFVVAVGAFAGLPLLWLAVLLAAGLAVWGCVSAVENLRKARETFDYIVDPLGQ